MLVFLKARFDHSPRNDAPLPHRDCSKNRAAVLQYYASLHLWVSITVYLAGSAQRHAHRYRHVVPDDGGFANHNALANGEIYA